MIEVVKGGLIIDLGRARLPARLAGRHPPRPEPRRVPRPEDRVQGDRAEPQPQQRRAVAARGARGGAQGGPPADPRPARARPGRGGHDLQHRRLRRVRGPRRHRRPDPHLRAFVGPREPSLRGPQHRRHRAVKVLDIDRERQRISLGLKQTQEDPWERVVRTYNVGDVLEGKVTKVVSFGAFVEIMEGVEGLVHISELAQHHVENPREVVEPGRRGEGQDPRDRRGAPPPVAQPEARRGPGAGAPRGAAVRGRRGESATCRTSASRRRCSRPRARPRPQTAEAAEAAEAPAEPRRSPRSPRPRPRPRLPPRKPPSRRAARRGRGGRRGRGRAAATPSRAEPAAEEQT